MFESPQCLPIPVLVLQGTDSSRGIHHSTHPEHGSPPRYSKRHRGQWVVSGELTRFSQAPQYRPASPTDRLLKRMETGRGGCCNPSPASVSDQVHQTSYPYEEAFKQDTGGSVDPDSMGWHCHACDASGDPVKWLEATEGLSFRDAVGRLASIAGIATDGAGAVRTAQPVTARPVRVQAHKHADKHKQARALWGASSPAAGTPGRCTWPGGMPGLCAWMDGRSRQICAGSRRKLYGQHYGAGRSPALIGLAASSTDIAAMPSTCGQQHWLGFTTVGCVFR